MKHPVEKAIDALAGLSPEDRKLALSLAARGEGGVKGRTHKRRTRKAVKRAIAKASKGKSAPAPTKVGKVRGKTKPRSLASRVAESDDEDEEDEEDE